MTALTPSRTGSEPELLELGLDYGERIVLVLLYGFLVRRLWPSLATEPVNALLLVAESVLVMFVMFRRTTSRISKNPIDWGFAFCGTLPPLLFAPGGHPLAPAAVAADLMIGGLMVEIYAKFFLRRSFGIAAANRGVQVTGPYRLIRHPMYLGYAITWSGFLAVNPTWRNAGLIAFALAMQVMRILVEERLLKNDPAYRAYMAKVRYRIVPGLF